ncbi:hypothetical protein QR680_012692 [Steinernema hermaphroditum]|uniref:Ubiquitin-protein ligase E3B n=1 Tax=Steinernema hermaphroditum TaxID=289476 RepID=A0AA39I557_9BILA|nr:hypothetical protein QR680_012692 [Steinernema hermaphroditum]
MLLSSADDDDQRRKFIERAAHERKERERLRKNIELARRLQCVCRGHLTRRAFRERIRSEVDSKLTHFVDAEENGKPAVVNSDILNLTSLLLRFATFEDDLERVRMICRYMVVSLEVNSSSRSFVALFLSKRHLRKANQVVSQFFVTLPSWMLKLDAGKMSEVNTVSLFVRFLVGYGTCDGWSLVKSMPSVAAVLNEMCAKVCSGMLHSNAYVDLSKVINRFVSRSQSSGSDAISLLFAVLFNPVRNSKYGTFEMTLFVRNVFVTPGLLTYLPNTALGVLISEGVFQHTLCILASQEISKELNGTEALALLANMIHLWYLNQKEVIEHLLDWAAVMNTLLARCREFTIGAKKKTHFHPILGWYSQRLDPSIEYMIGPINHQLSFLWTKNMVHCLFGSILQGANSGSPSSSPNTEAPASSLGSDVTSSIQKLWKKFSMRDNPVTYGGKSIPPVSMTAVICQLYQNALLTLVNIQTDLLSGLCREDYLLPLLWSSISSSSQDSGLTFHLNLLASDRAQTLPHFAPLMLFADTAASVISILDEEEMYERGTPFSLSQLSSIAKFANVFCFRAVWNDLFDYKTPGKSPLFDAIYQLCMTLYNRDSRRSFTQHSKFWHAPDVKSTWLISEFERKSDRGVHLMTNMPHLVPLKERMVLFRKLVTADKDANDVPSTMITVERQRLVEDGYRLLASLSPQALKATIRVKFINYQGLDEAGIDQDGVFKEFLELTLKKVFDPSLNLFKSTTNRQLYPSPTSNVHEDHLALFQFVGRMLAKAVYEGIVVDVQLAAVLLATVLQRRLCAFDELSLLDADLYKSLTYVKHYKDSDDVSDLALTFSTTEDYLGQLKTVDLIPGGRFITVSNENKIVYIHKMAQYRVFSQTKEQCRWFVSGFQSVMNASWIGLFAPHELQILISGQSADIDLIDLRKNVQYYGGFHNNHRLIKWLWQILEQDFSAQERQLFVKFVTSCSRGPLLGFSTLEPPFSIRCVEVSDDQDQGDTLASVVRGFLAIKKRQPSSRLPTASTCFNLLKLPNYNKRSTLLQKLRYAIHSETGFELS